MEKKKYYTFSVEGKDGKTYYPKEFLWNKEEVQAGTGLLDFEWTENIDEARLWSDRDVCDSIAFEYYSEIIEIEK